MFPDTANVNCSFQVSGDTLWVNFENLSGTMITGMFCSLFDEQPAEIVECRIDGAWIEAPEIEIVFGSIYVDRYTTTLVMGSFDNSAELKLWPFSGAFTFSGSHLYPFFGMTPAIGPPVDVMWVE
ncbi:MAG: hypothetical protein AB1483_00880 [Candidatus Zixiibacteriota bacterium]